VKVAVTADVHLGREGEHPERLEALGCILDTAESRGIPILVIAGDLFDQNSTGYSGFEQLCRRHPGIQVHLIPGNHDPDISGKTVVGDNITVHRQVTSVDLDGVSMVFVPYCENSGMCDSLGNLNTGGRWVLVGHGDYLGGLKERNPYEKGTYMPLYRKDLELLKPWRVFLGHIHKPLKDSSVYYPGSPCGLDINETGRRSFLLFDTSTGKVDRETVDTAVIYFRESFLVIPDELELDRLRKQAEARTAAWGLTAGERPKARVRVEARGFSSDREAVMECLRESFSDYTFHSGELPDISGLRIAGDGRRTTIARRAIELIEDLDWEYGGEQPDKEQVMEAALGIIFGDGAG